MIDGFLVHEVWLVIWTDDFDMVGTDDAPMFLIQDKCNTVWAVKQVPDTYMVGIQRKFHESNGILYGTLSMPTYIEGMQAMCFEHLVRAGWTKGKVPSTPFPKEQLTLHDPHNLLTDEEVERVQKRGFRSIKDLTTWVARNCFPECKFGDSQTVKVMSRPS